MSSLNPIHVSVRHDTSLVPAVEQSVKNADFATHLRHWRKLQRCSQQKLAELTDLSYRHINFLENNRSKPSSEVVLKIAGALELSLKNTNVLLRSAGFASQYATTPLDQSTMRHVNKALDQIINQQEPYPGVVMSPIGGLIQTNKAALKVFSHFLPLQKLSEFSNAYELFLSADGFRPYVKNWQALAPRLLSLVRQEAIALDSMDEAFCLLQRLQALSGIGNSWQRHSAAVDQPPLFEMQLSKGDLSLAFFSTYTSFGTPFDVALQEMRIECFYPADDVTEAFCRQL